MNNIILVYSPCQATGKSYLSKELVTRKIVNNVDSFAVYIKKLSHDLHQAVSYLTLSKEEFYQTKKDEKLLNGKSPRDLVCSLSDMVQEYYGTEVWGQVVYDEVFQYVTKNVKEDETYTLIIDDWRRKVESDYLEKQGTFNVIKVYLEKEGLKSKASKGSSHYEGQITPEDCDIVFKYDKKYSNFEELIGLIKDVIK